MKFFLTYSHSQKAKYLFDLFSLKYGSYIASTPEDSDVIVVFGGDGFMLEVLHRYYHLNIPFYGINCGTIGFLMNVFIEGDFIEILEKSYFFYFHPVTAEIELSANKKKFLNAVNEISFLRMTGQAAKIRISIDNIVRLEELVCDGIIFSTPAGSTAYNHSAHGPILPLNCNALVLTPISPFYPRNWRGAILPKDVVVEVEILNPEKRPVSLAADFQEFASVLKVKMYENKKSTFCLLFDYPRHFGERILEEQFPKVI